MNESPDAIVTRSGEPVISVVVPNYNGRLFLSECLESLFEQSFRNAETVVVDNASTDGSAELVEREYPDVHLVRLTTNKGYAAAVNAGISVARGDFIVVLNNDTRAEPEFVRELYMCLSEEPAAAMAAPKMLFARAPKIINSMGLGYSITGTNHDIGFGVEDGSQFGARNWVFGPCGGAGMYRRSVFEDVGPFDEDFFMYYEDVDYGFRAQLAGHRCIFVPTARVHHAEGGSGWTLPRSRDYYFARNSFAVILKNFPARLMLKHSHTILWEIAKRAVSPLRRGDVSALRGYGAALGRIVSILRKRHDVQRRKKVSDGYIEDILKKNRTILKEINLRGRPVEELQ